MNITLTRDPRSAQLAACMVGRLRVGSNDLFTLERPWIASPTHIGGTPGRSCVPPGVYALERHNSEAHPRSFALVNHALGVAHWDAPNMRSVVLIHVANRVAELRGCIALGRDRLVMSATEYELRRSADAVKIFNQLVPWKEGHTLEIKQEG